MKRIISLLIACVLTVVCVVGFVGCGKDGTNGKNGTNGQDGKSAYQIWLDNGHSGTEQDFLNWLKGEKGDQGQQGTPGQNGANGQDGQNGKDGVGIADIKIENGKLYVKYTNGNDYVDLGQVKGENGQNGQDGTTPTIEISADGYWVIGGIKTEAKAIGTDGKDGTNGKDGQNGQDGKDGEDGKSAYEIWLACGNTGSEEDFLNYIKGSAGEKGANGKSAYEIFKDYYPDYTGSEMDWITAVAMGDKCALFGHKYDDGVITKQPTKNETGEMTYTCSVCKGTKVEVLPKLQLPTTYEENGRKHVNWGTYPQTHVSDTTLVAELNKLTETNCRGYYSYNGEEYAKVTATPYATGDAYLYSDGTAVTSNTTEWFKVEPIKWKVAGIDAATGSVKVMSTVILDKSYYYKNQDTRTIDGETIYSNNYKYSDLREFLNNSFYNTAFTSLQQSAILTTEVDNSMRGTNYADNGGSTNNYVCENTFDKIYALSHKEAKASFFGDNTEVSRTERLLKVTDFAKAKGVYWEVSSSDYIGNGEWWLRSPNYYNDHSASRVYYASALWAINVDDAKIGVVPAMQLSVA